MQCTDIPHGTYYKCIISATVQLYIEFGLNWSMPMLEKLILSFTVYFFKQKINFKQPTKIVWVIVVAKCLALKSTADILLANPWLSNLKAILLYNKSEQN